MDASYFPCQKTAHRIFRRSATLESFASLLPKTPPAVLETFLLPLPDGLSGEGIEVSLEPATSLPITKGALFLILEVFYIVIQIGTQP